MVKENHLKVWCQVKLVQVHKTMIVKTVMRMTKWLMIVEIEDCLIIVESQKSCLALRVVLVRQSMMGLTPVVILVHLRNLSQWLITNGRWGQPLWIKNSLLMV